MSKPLNLDHVLIVSLQRWRQNNFWQFVVPAVLDEHQTWISHDNLDRNATFHTVNFKAWLAWRVMPGVRLIVTIATVTKICQRSQRLNGHITVDDPSDFDHWNRIRLYSSDRLSDRDDRERSKWSYRHRTAIVNDSHISQDALQFTFISCWFWFAPKNKILVVFERLERLNGHDSAIADCSWTLTVIITIVTIKWTPGFKDLKIFSS